MHIQFIVYVKIVLKSLKLRLKRIGIDKWIEILIWQQVSDSWP